MYASTSRRRRGLGWPWTYAPNDGRGGYDAYPDGCNIKYVPTGDGALKWSTESGPCGVRAPLTDGDLPWIDKNGTRHQGVSNAERDWMYAQWGRTYDPNHTQNRAANSDEIALARAALRSSAPQIDNLDSAGIKLTDVAAAGTTPAGTTPAGKTPAALSDSNMPLVIGGAVGAFLLWKAFA